MSEHETAAVQTSKKSKLIITGLLLLSLALLIGLGVVYRQYVQVKNDPKTAQNAQQKQNDELIAKVGKLIALPKNEKPVIASVDDKTKLKDQPFFKDAENGDKLLMYAQTKKAIIYRESTNQLINVGPIAITSDTASNAGTTTTTAPKTTTKN